MSDILIKNKKPPRCCGICYAESNHLCCLTDERNPNNPRFWRSKQIPIENMRNGRPDWCPLIVVKKINRLFYKKAEIEE